MFSILGIVRSLYVSPYMPIHKVLELTKQLDAKSAQIFELQVGEYIQSLLVLAARICFPIDVYIGVPIGVWIGFPKDVVVFFTPVYRDACL